MNTLFSGLFFRVLELSFHGGLALVLVATLRFLVGRHIAPRYRCFLWLPALLAFLVPVDLLPQNPVALPAQPAVAERVENIRLYWEPEILTPVPPPLRVLPEGDLSDAAFSGAAAQSGERNFSWLSLLAAAWLAGVVLFGTLGLLGSWRFHRKVRLSLKEPEEKTLRIWREIAGGRPAGMPGILSSYGVHTPVLAGLFKPMVILPAEREKSYNEEMLRHIFRHELAHYRRGDLYFLALEHSVLILHWFNPLLWASHHFIRVDRELGADASALDEMDETEADSYGQSLLEVAGGRTSSENRLSAVGIFESKKQLAQRLRGIASHRKAGWFAAAGVTAALVIVCLFIFGRGPKADLTPYAFLPEERALVQASIQGDVPAVRQYLKSKPDLNHKVEGPGSETALLGAAGRGQVEVMKLLLAAGADPNFKSSKGLSACDVSMRKGRPEATELLLRHGAKVDEATLAAYKGDTTFFETLFKSGKSFPFDDSYKLTGIAATNDRLDLYRLLLTTTIKGPLPEWNYPGEDDLLTVMARGHKDILQETLDTHPEGLSRFKNGPVRIAEAARQIPGMKEWLEERGFKVSDYPPGEELIDATGRNDLFRMKQLLDAGVDPNYSGESGWSPVVKAANSNKIEAIQLLLSRGGNPNSVKSPGANWSALTLCENPKIADLLYAAGADVNGKLYGKDVHIISYPITFGVTAMVEWFISKGVDVKTAKGDEPTLLFEVGNAAVAELLLKQGIDPNVQDKSGRTALFNVRGYGEKPAKILKVLLEHGADPNLADQYGNTPLMTTMDGDSVNVLLEHGANPNAKNKNGQGVLDMSGYRADSSRLKALLAHGFKMDRAKTNSLLVQAALGEKSDLVALLLEMGGDPNAKVEFPGRAGYFQEPMTMAALQGNMETLKLLLDKGGKPETGMPTALGNYRKAVVQLLWEKGARNIPESTYLMSQGAPLAQVKAMLQKEGKLVWKEKYYFAHPFVYACSASKKDVTDSLWEVYQTDKIVLENGLAGAASEGNWEIVDFLLKKGVPATPAILSGAVANSNASYRGRRKAEDFVKTVGLLITAGALKDAVEKDRSAVIYSAFYNCSGGCNREVVRQLMAAGLTGNEKSEISGGKTLLEVIRSNWERGYHSDDIRESYQLLGGNPGDLKM